MKRYYTRRDGRKRGVSRDEGDVIINGGHIKVKAGTGASGIGGTGDMRYPSEGIKLSLIHILRYSRFVRPLPPILA